MSWWRELSTPDSPEKKQKMRNLNSLAKPSAVALSLMLVLSNLFVSAAGQSTPVAAQGPPVDLRGIYIYTNDVSQITQATANALTASFNIPGVDGVAVVIGWDAIEPA